VREIVGARSHRQQGDITPIAAAGDADPRRIDKGELLQPFDRGDIVMDLPFAEAAMHRVHPLSAVIARAAMIQIEDNDALLRHVEIVEHGKTVAHNRRAGAAVNLKNDRIFAGFVHGRRQDPARGQIIAIAGGNSKDLAGAQGVLIQGRQLLIAEEADLSPLAVSEEQPRLTLEGGEIIREKSPARSNAASVGAGIGGQFFQA